MEKETKAMQSAAMQSIEHIDLRPVLVEEEFSITSYTKLPLSRIPALGTAFEPLASAIQTVLGSSSATSGLYKVTIPTGTHLAEFKSGVGNLGTALNANNQIAGQAVLNPLVCDPATIFMAAALASIDKKLDVIQELQQEMMDFLVQKDRAALRGNLIFLADILSNYRFNWNNDLYKNSNHIKVLDVRQEAEQKIQFYREQISSKLRKKAIIHSDKDTQKQLDRLQADFREYQLALYMQGFASFLDVMLVGNYASEYLCGVIEKLENYSWEYRELYSKCYDQMESLADSSVQSTLLKGLKHASKVTGAALAKVPVLNKGPVDDAFLEAGTKLEKLEEKRTQQKMRSLIARQSAYVKPFVENIESIERLYNNPITMAFDEEMVYLGITANT